jgi:hypothetical protein
MAVLGKRKKRTAEAETTDSAADSQSIQDIFRRHFEAQFAPLPEGPAGSSKNDKRGEDDDGESESEEEDEEWGGLSNDEQREEEDSDDLEEESDEGKALALACDKTCSEWRTDLCRRRKRRRGD